MQYTSFDTTIENVVNQLDTYGIAVIPNILNNTEIAAMQTGMWDILAILTSKMDNPIKSNDSETWKSFYNLLPLHSMLLQHYKVGHHQSIWDVRQNPNVVNVFAKIWNVKPDELLTSFDGCSIHFPPEKTGRGYFKDKLWLHVDQSYTRNNKECIQGFVTAFDINDGDATLTVLEKSHLYHEACKQKFNIDDKADWYLINDEQYKFYKDKGCERRCIKAKAGSLVLWDSRTVHCGQESLKTRLTENFRFVAYVCQTPRNLANTNDLHKKTKAFDEMRLTTHNPHKVKLFPKNPRTYGTELPNVGDIAKPNLSNLGLKLAGF